MNLRAIGARVRHLLVPYLIWSAVVLIGLALEGRVFTGTRYLWMLATGATNPNYYYVPLLVQLYLVAPALVLLSRWNWKVLLGVTGALQVAVYLLQYVVVLDARIPIITTLAGLPKWLFLVQLFWFTSGVVAGFQHQALKSALERIRWMLIPSVIALFVIGFVEWELLLRWSGSPWVENRLTLIDGLYAAAVILTYFAYAEVELPFSNALVALGGRSFGIYLVHGIVMEYLARGLYHVAPWVLGWQILLQPILIGFSLTIPLVLMLLISRSNIRGLYTYLFG